MNEDIKNLFDAFKEVIEEQNAKIDELTGKLNEIMDGAESAYNDWDYNNRLNDFSDRNKDTDFDSYNDKLKLIEGDDFDFKKKVFDDYEASDKSVGESEYVAGVIAHVSEQLKQLREALADETGENIDTVAASQSDEQGDGDPDTTVAATNEDGEVVTEASVDTEENEQPDEPAEEDKAEPVEDSGEIVETEDESTDDIDNPEANPSDEELEEFVRGLEEEKARQSK